MRTHCLRFGTTAGPPEVGTAAVWAGRCRGHGRMLTASRVSQRLETQPRQTSGCQEGLLVFAQVGILSTSVPALLYLLSPDRDSCGITKYLNASLCRHSDTGCRPVSAHALTWSPPSQSQGLTGQRGSPSFPGATYIRIWAELDEKALPLEAQLPHLCPVEGIDLREALGRKVSAGEPGNA